MKGQPDQKRVWLPLLGLLTLSDLLIALPVHLWPGQLLATAVSVGFSTWYLTASVYLWLTYWYSSRTHITVKPDYLIILGARVTPHGPTKTLTRRLETALTFLTKQSQSPKVILTGGQGSDEPDSEASVMSAFLKKHQVEPHRLLLEEKATSTATNFKYSKQIINSDWHQLTEPNLLVVTSDYHLVRSKLLAWQQHLTIATLGAWTTTAALFPAMLREVAALLLQLKYPLIAGWIIVTFLIQCFIY
ncbi:YdcF family protein [Secundilactobacillus sp. HBUAS58055]|nr:YdcF family protein [Secundilactobacillus angelensis]MCH5461523.1 YdcF family protein [Secundilactobacillus angelensis]